MAPRPQAYVPSEQSPVGAMTLVVLSNENALSFRRSLRNVMGEIDKDQAITEMKTLEGVAADASALPRVSAALFAISASSYPAIISIRWARIAAAGR